MGPEIIDRRRVVSAKPWHYERCGTGDIVEVATVKGSAVALPDHFHDEDQVTFVLAGHRRFRVAGELVQIPSGRGLFIGAGTPHSSLDEPRGVACWNIYLRAGTINPAWLLDELARAGDESARLPLEQLVNIVQTHRAEAPARYPAQLEPIELRAGRTIKDVAARAGMSREGFSRRFRRTYDLPPGAFRNLIRLNLARRLLRTGAPAAAVAAEVGFADQSHLGRSFLRAFGVTPGRYREG